MYTSGSLSPSMKSMGSHLYLFLGFRNVGTVRGLSFENELVLGSRLGWQDQGLQRNQVVLDPR